MPLYDYTCPRCGDFRVLRPLREASLPAQCPFCLADAPRQIAAPFLPRLKANTRIAHERNEKSAHEPRVAATPEGGSAGHEHHDHAHHPSGWIRSSHPWMIGH